mmetsp:Transcript_30137/g.88140  ORF Transcript_30137/g.88140 Transcript_30137/m.88140 type:complete len:213 (-) Transcript_30137:2360-2998(-)
MAARGSRGGGDGSISSLSDFSSASSGLCFILMAASMDARGSAPPFSVVLFDVLALTASSTPARGSPGPFSSGLVIQLGPFDLIADKRAARGSTGDFSAPFPSSLPLVTIAESKAPRVSTTFDSGLFDWPERPVALPSAIASGVSLVGIIGLKRKFSFSMTLLLWAVMAFCIPTICGLAATCRTEASSLLASRRATPEVQSSSSLFSPSICNE